MSARVPYGPRRADRVASRAPAFVDVAGKYAEQRAETGDLDRAAGRLDEAARRTATDGPGGFVGRRGARSVWGDRSRFEFGGWAYVLGDPRSCAAGTRVQVVFESVGVPPVLATTDRRDDPEVNVGSNDPEVDWAPAGFTARLDLSELIERLPAGEATMKWTARVELADAEWSTGGRMTKRYRWGSAGEMSTEGFPDDIHVQPVWSDENGLVLTVARKTLVADTVELHGRTLTGTIRANGRFVPDRVLLAYRGSDRHVGVSVDAEGPRTRFRVDVPEAGVADALPTLAYLYGVDSAGRRRHIHWTRGRGVEYDSGVDRSGLFIRRGASGVIRVEERRRGAGRVDRLHRR